MSQQTPVASTSTAGAAQASNSDQSLTTLYVTKLAANVTSDYLATLFSDIGPIKSAFVVPEKETGASRGFGYVKFALREDCDKAIQLLNGSLQNGKKIGVEWANRRSRDGEKAAAVKSTADAVEKPQRIERKQRAIDISQSTSVAGDVSSYAFKCIVVLRIFGTGPAGNVDSNQDTNGIEEKGSDAEDADDNGTESLKKGIYKKAKKLLAVASGRSDSERPLKVEYPVAGSASDIAHIHAPSPRLASLLAQKLNNHILKSRLLLAHLLHEAATAQRKGKNTAGGRLVIRNLAFDLETQDLYAKFAPFGPIADIDLPNDGKSVPGHNKGFAFVWFLRKSDAENALAKVNGKTIPKGLVAERIKEGGEGKKQTRQRLKKEKSQAQEDITAGTERVVAVDWALSKDAWQASLKEEAQAEQEDATMADTVPNGSSLHNGNGAASSDAELEEDSEEEDDLSPEEISDGDAEEDEDEEMTPEALSDNDDASDDDRIAARAVSDKGKESAAPGTTLFVRNIQFEATEDELYSLFKSFGAVKYARIVIDQTTNRSRGTGFVCFYKDADARKVLELADKIASRDAAKDSAAPLNPFAPSSVFTADPSSSTAASLTLHGRVLGIISAVSRDDADRLREDRDRKGAKKDRRSLYLLREGVFSPDSPEATSLSKTDMEARDASYEARKRLLRTNPSLFVSRTRLSIRQLPLFVTENVLKKLATYAIKQFNVEFKAGQREGLTADELRVENESEILGGNLAPVKVKTKKDGTVLPPKRVRQAKILRQDDRLDTFSDALRAVRWLNGNHAVGKQLRSWWSADLETNLSQLDSLQDLTEDERNGKRKRLQQKLEELRADAAREGGRMTRTIIAEFSIENIQTVRRREQKKESAGKRSKDRITTVDGDRNSKSVKRKAPPENGENPRSKKAKLDTKPQQKSNLLGSIISRKRKAKRQAKS